MKIPQGVEMIGFAMLIGVLTAISRGGNKGIEIHWARASLIAGILTIIFSSIYIYVFHVDLQYKQLLSNFWYVVGPAIAFMIIRPLVIIGFQKGFTVNSFSLLFTLFGIFFTILMGVLFYKEVITTKQGLGIVFAICAVRLLK